MRSPEFKRVMKEYEYVPSDVDIGSEDWLPGVDKKIGLVMVSYDLRQWRHATFLERLELNRTRIEGYD